MTAPSLASVIAALAPASEGFTLDAPPAWSQGRTLYGGMSAALAWAAATRAFVDLPPLRSVQAAFVGPAAGLLTFAPTILRRGRSATSIGVDVVGEAGLAARLTFFCGAARPSRVTHSRVEAPIAAPPDDLPATLTAGQGPIFAGNFDIRHAGGGLPYGGGEPDYLMWARLRQAEVTDPVAALLALADVLPPAAMVVFLEFGMISTLSWSFDLDRLPTNAGAWYLCRACSQDTADGYSRQAMDLWDADGRRILAGRQTVAIFV